MFTEAYLEQSRISMMELFCKNSSRFLVDNYFLQKRFLTDVWLGPNYASGSLDVPHKMVPLTRNNNPEEISVR